VRDVRDILVREGLLVSRCEYGLDAGGGEREDGGEDGRAKISCCNKIGVLRRSS
jgi:hypothetical protein